MKVHCGIYRFPVALTRARRFSKRAISSTCTVRALAAVARLAPVEAAGVETFDNRLYVDDRRTSLITYPANGRLPTVLPSVKRMPVLQDFLVFLADAKGPPSPSFMAMVALRPSLSCLAPQPPPIKPPR